MDDEREPVDKPAVRPVARLLAQWAQAKPSGHVHYVCGFGNVRGFRTACGKYFDHLTLDWPRWSTPYCDVCEEFCDPDATWAHRDKPHDTASPTR